MPQVPRSSLPGEIYAVPVTMSILVDARGVTEDERKEDAKVQARKWGGNAVRDIGEPKVLGDG